MANTEFSVRKHNFWLAIFSVLMVAHWAEHLIQMGQVAAGHARHESRGALGQIFPWLVKSESLHFGYAVLTMVGLVALLYGFSGKARVWWKIAMGIQVWHLLEHTLLFWQAMGGFTLFGSHEPVSVLQTVFPKMRIELHVFYNTVVTLPMVVAMMQSYLQRHRGRVLRPEQT